MKETPDIDMGGERLYKLSEVEKILSCSRSSLRRWIRDGKLKAIKIGGSGPKSASPWRVSATSLRDFQRAYGTTNVAANGGTENGT